MYNCQDEKANWPPNKEMEAAPNPTYLMFPYIPKSKFQTGLQRDMFPCVYIYISVNNHFTSLGEAYLGLVGNKGVYHNIYT